MPLFNFSLSDSKLTCPYCGRERQESLPGQTWVCPGCRTSYEVDSQGRLRHIAAAPDMPLFTVVLSCLDDLEIVGWRMIAGIGHFLTHTMWSWLWKQLISLSRIIAKAVRVGMVFACWAVISFAPLLLVWQMEATGLLPLVALVWTGLALGGSLWGALYIRHRLQPFGLLRRIVHWRKRKPPKPSQEKAPVEANSSDWFPFDNPKPQKGTVVVNNHV
jgi:hypothetical protein